MADYAQPPELKYSHPFTWEDLEDLDLGLISQEITKLEKSLSMLQSTNAQLLEMMSELGVGSMPNSSSSKEVDEEKREYEEILSENERAIAAQTERIEMCIWTIKKRLGVDPSNAHYSVATAAPLPHETTIRSVTTPREGLPSGSNVAHDASAGTTPPTSAGVRLATDTGLAEAPTQVQASADVADNVYEDGLYL